VTQYVLPKIDAASVAPSVDASRADLDAVARDTGVDVDDALRLANGDAALYRKVLATLCDDHAEDAKQMRRALDDGDLVRLGRLAHTLAGTAGYAGDHRLARFASDLEAAARSNERENELARMLLVLERRLDRIVASIQRHVHAAGPRPDDPPRAPEAESVLDASDEPWTVLRALVQDDDPAAAVHWSRHADVLEARAGTLAKGVAEALEAYDLPTALALIERIDDGSGREGGR
jgi:HPt (histidine-containing phosphotransfer) domain-containing protein